MLYDEKTGVISLSLGELVTLSLHRYASETANDRDNDILSPAPQAVGAPRALTLSFEEGGHRFALSATLDGEEEGMPGLPPRLFLARAIPCSPDTAGKEILRRVRGEAFGLAYMYIKEKGCAAVRVKTRLVHPTEGSEAEFEETVTAAAAEKFFAKLRACLGSVAAEEVDRVCRRLPTLRELRFPYKERRTAQDDLMQATYRAIRSGKRLFACAPTGTGKTAGVLYPALRALGAGLCERVFYLTPKTTTARAAADTLSRFAEAGAKLRAVVLVAKERICTEKMACRDPMTPCRYYHAGGEREEQAALSLLASPAVPVTEREIVAAAEKFGVCPYELSLRYSMFCDVIVCDYNYLFDTRVYLRRYFDRAGNYCFLVDEAHDLLERAREMYSTSLSLSALDELLLFCRGVAGAGDIAAAVKELRGSFVARVKAALSGERRFEDSDGVTHAFAAEKEAPYDLFFAAGRAGELGIRALSDRALPLQFKQSLAKMCYPLRDFALRADLYSERFETFYVREGEEYTVKILCLDPAAALEARLSRGTSAVLFSATLTPLDYYRAVLGGGGQDETLLLDSPFEEENLCVAVMDKISTRFTARTESAPAIAEAIYAMVSARVGNYFVFCPSFAYMDEILRAFHARYPEIRLAAQKKGTSAAAREEFLSLFLPEPKETLVGFCVTGGVFAEGIDLVGTRLIGAAVVGVAMPQISPERDAMCAYYGDLYEAGKEYAYLYPGMNRVLQAAGRVIRTEADRGALLLIDDRFAEPLYRDLIPTHWRHLKYVGDSATAGLLFRRFWRETEK